MGPREETVTEAEYKYLRVLDSRREAAERARKAEWDRWDRTVIEARADVVAARNRAALDEFRGRLWEHINGL